MPVRFIYVDESYDADRLCLSALAVRHSVWKQCFDEIKAHRVILKNDYGIPLSKEIHATDLVGGRGQLSSSQVIGKWQRSRIFFGILKLAATLPEVFLFNVCLDKRHHADAQMVAWDRLLNRIERTLLKQETDELPLRRRLSSSAQQSLSEGDWQSLNKRLNNYRSRAFIIADEGREYEIERAIRKMRVFNPIPSRYGEWGTGSRTKNITTDRIIEDPMFKKSERSYFIQVADCIAFALLKREVQPTPHVKKYGLHKMFDETLTGICFKKASPADPLGIVRK